jgi:hypothetical protein
MNLDVNAKLPLLEKCERQLKKDSCIALNSFAGKSKALIIFYFNGRRDRAWLLTASL